MNKEIIFSRNQYKEKYNDLLESYLSNGYEDLEQIDFIESEILLYKKYININYSLSIENHFAGRTLSEGYNVILNATETQIKDKLYSIDSKFNEQTYTNINTSFTKIIKFLELQKLYPTTIKTNLKHESIFCNNGFKLFEYILNEYIKPIKGRQSDLIFYYWKMYKNEPQYIHQRPTEFFNWFENNYNEVFGQLKTLSQVETPQRNKDYSNALNWFKLQNK